MGGRGGGGGGGGAGAGAGAGEGGCDGGGGRGDRVVVVGGGIAGALLAKRLQYIADVVLIDSKEYFEIPWAKLRATVEPSAAERSIFNHSDYLTNGRIVIATATDITETEVVTSVGHVIAYDYLAIATGSSGIGPRCRRDKLEKFQEDNQKIKYSQSILIIGGGPVGVELAAEIAKDYPQKKLTLVHSGPRLLEFIGEKASHKALDWLRSRNVEVLLEQSIDLDTISEAHRAYKTSVGKTIIADCHFVCVGGPVGSSWLQHTILKDHLDKKGRLMVDKNLRVRGLKNIFALGDITDIPEPKQGYNAQRHAMTVSKNLKLMIEGGKESKLQRYKPRSPVTMVTLGRKDAVAELPIGTLTGFLLGMIKSRDLFVGKTRKLMGVDGTHKSSHHQK